MVLVNAVYFKGLWEHQFSEAATREGDFWTSEKESVKVPMMFIKKKFRMCYHRDLGASVLSMDYKVGQTMFFFLF